MLDFYTLRLNFGKRYRFSQSKSTIAKHREGVLRADIESHLKMKGGLLTKRLDELEAACFI